MDRELLFRIIDNPEEHTIPMPLTIESVRKVYNENALVKYKYTDFLNAISEDRDLHDRFMEKKEDATRKWALIIQETQNKLVEKAIVDGDFNSMKMLLTSKAKDEWGATMSVNVKTEVEFKQTLEEKQRVLLEMAQKLPDHSYQEKQYIDADVIAVGKTYDEADNAADNTDVDEDAS